MNENLLIMLKDECARVIKIANNAKQYDNLHETL